jgi:hypothetical protein
MPIQLDEENGGKLNTDRLEIISQPKQAPRSFYPAFLAQFGSGLKAQAG